MANAGLPENRIQEVCNSRGIKELVLNREHITIEDLRTRDEMKNKKMFAYLSKTIPHYPKPVEFQIANITHVTNKMGLEKILASNGFNGSKESHDLPLSWWSLMIDERDIKAAEKHHLQNEFPNREKFLDKFTTSPAFQNHVSRYGNFRFTVPLTELMEKYKQQMCGGQNPVLRVYQTKLYKQEIVYAVLIHKPQLNEQFKEYPELISRMLVSYESGKIIWKAQAICETHRNELVLTPNKQISVSEIPQNKAQYYVWDNVCIAFHLNVGEIIQISEENIEKVTYCESDSKRNLSRENYRSLTEAQEILCNILKQREEGKLTKV